jgi:hypothetical protein
MHSTQVFVGTLQAFLPVTVAQSVFARHCTQVLSVSQTPFGAGQWLFEVQPTHVLSGVLHAGLSDGQCVSLVQLTHACAVVSHAGVAPEQFASDMQATQLPEATLHAGVAPLQ